MICSSIYFSICDYEIVTLSAYKITYIATCAVHAEAYKYLLYQESSDSGANTPLHFTDLNCRYNRHVPITLCNTLIKQSNFLIKHAQSGNSSLIFTIFGV